MVPPPPLRLMLLVASLAISVAGSAESTGPIQVVPEGNSGAGLARLLGRDAAATARVIARRGYRFAHEAGVWLPQSGEVLFTSHQEAQPDGSVASFPYAVSLATGEVRGPIPFTPDVLNPGGGTAAGDGRVLLCSMGRGSVGGRIQLLEVPAPGTDQPGNLTDLATTYPCPGVTPTGRCAFNSPNDITLTPDGGHAWFTDPLYGEGLGYVDLEALGNTRTPAVYHLDMRTGEVTNALPSCCLGLAPNGILLSPDGTTLYMTSFKVAGYVYRMDVTYFPDGRPPALSNFTEFYSPRGTWTAPDGLKADVLGNLYIGCSDGVHVVSPAGRLLGRVVVWGGVANLVFAGPEYRTLVLLNERRIITMETAVPGAARNGPLTAPTT